MYNIWAIGYRHRSECKTATFKKVIFEMLNRRMKVIIKYRSASSIFPVKKKKQSEESRDAHYKTSYKCRFQCRKFQLIFLNFIINFVFLSTKFISSAGTEII